MDKGTERRVAELRADPDGRRLSGIVMPYGEVSPTWRERFEAGAFGDVSAVDVILNRQHDPSRPLARTGGGGLSLDDGADALRMAASLPDVAEARDAAALVAAGILRGLSVEFRAIDEADEGGVRVIRRAELRGLAVVDRAGYPGATVAARAAGDAGRRRGRWR